jgi:hypothetical protein
MVVEALEDGEARLSSSSFSSRIPESECRIADGATDVANE